MDLYNIINIGELIKKVEIHQDVNLYGFIPFILGLGLFGVWGWTTVHVSDYDYESRKAVILRNNRIILLLTFLTITSWLVTFIVPMMIVRNETQEVISQLRYLTSTYQGLRFNLTPIYEKYNEIIAKNNPNEMMLLVDSHIHKLFIEFPTFINKVDKVVILNFETFPNLDGLGAIYNVIFIITGIFGFVLLIAIFYHFKITREYIRKLG